jgi:hypothetical protein
MAQFASDNVTQPGLTQHQGGLGIREGTDHYRTAADQKDLLGAKIR